MSRTIKENVVIKSNLYLPHEKEDSVTDSKESCNIDLTPIRSTPPPWAVGEGRSGRLSLFRGLRGFQDQAAGGDGHLDGSGSLQQISWALNSTCPLSAHKQMPDATGDTEVHRAGGSIEMRTHDTFIFRMCWPSTLSSKVLPIEEHEEEE